MRRFLLPVVVVSGLIAYPAPAQGRRVTLKLRDVSSTDAVTALNGVTGAGIRLRPEIAPEGRASFQWNNVPFSKALREVCERFKLRAIPGGGGIDLFPDVGSNPVHRFRNAEVEQDGYRLYVSDVRLRTDGQPGKEQAAVGLTIDLDLGEHERSEVENVSPVRAEDELGNRLTRTAPSSFPQRFHLDEWAVAFSVAPVRPEAHRLVWLEGDLIGHRTNRPMVLPVAAIKPGAKARATAGGNAAEIEFPKPGHGDGVKALLTVVPRDGLQIDPDSVSFPVLIGKSGRPYPSIRGNWKHRASGGRRRYEMTGSFNALPEPIVSARFHWMERSPEARILTFRMKDIPIPLATGRASYTESPALFAMIRLPERR